MMKIFCIFAMCFLLGSLVESATLDEGDSANNTVVGLLHQLAGHMSNGGLTTRLDILAKVVETVDLAMKLSPLMRAVFKEAATKNPELDIALKVIGGKVPDATDFIHLLTYKHQTIATSLTEAMANSKEVKQFNQIRAESGIRSSPRKLATIVKLLTGKTVVFHPELVNAMATGTYTTNKDNAAELGLLNIAYFVIDSWDNVISSTQLKGTTKDAVGILQNLAKLDISDLMNVKVLKTGMDNGKYKVDGGESLVPDSDVISLRADLQGAKALTHSVHDQDVAAKNVTSVFHDFCSLCVHATDRFVNEQATSKQDLVG